MNKIPCSPCSSLGFQRQLLKRWKEFLQTPTSTFVVTAFHLLFDFLAFKKWHQFLKEKQEHDWNIHQSSDLALLHSGYITCPSGKEDEFASPYSGRHWISNWTRESKWLFLGETQHLNFSLALIVNLKGKPRNMIVGYVILTLLCLYLACCLFAPAYKV